MARYALSVRPRNPDAELPSEDAALARRIAAATSRGHPDGDPEAEAALCRRFAPRIRLFGLKRLRSEAAASDLVQDVLVLTLQKLRSGAVTEPERIASFVLGIARQMIIDARRNAGRRERLLDAFALDLEPANDEPNDEPAGEPDTARLGDCLQALPERERSVLVMTFYDDCGAEVLSARLGLTPGNVRVIRHRGLRHLRDCLEAAR
jgi:RNA polymerase sigma-70 factor (ECF subfamily)